MTSNIASLNASEDPFDFYPSCASLPPHFSWVDKGKNKTFMLTSKMEWLLVVKTSFQNYILKRWQK